MSLTVIKIGGSLMRSTTLPHWLARIETLSKDTNIIIVPGGGEFADSIQNLQHELHYDDITAHKMALLSMCQFGQLLVGLNKNLRIIEHIDEISANAGNKLPSIWLPTALISDHSEIPASWDYTSDSIALWLAIKLAASRLVIVKSKSIEIDKNALINNIKNGEIDKGFQTFIDCFLGELLFFEKTQYKQLKA